MKKAVIPVLVSVLVVSMTFIGCQSAPEPEPAPVASGLTAKDVPELKQFVDNGQISPDLLMNPYEGFAVKADGTPYKFGVGYLFLGVDWCVQNDGIIRSYLKRAGAEATYFNPNADVAQQVSWVEDQIASKQSDALFIHAVDETSLASVCDQAIESGLPVFQMDFDIPTEQHSTLAFHDFGGPYGANQVGEFFVDLAQKSGEKLRIFEVWGDMATISARVRHEAFHRVVDQYPELITEVVESGDTRWSDETAASFVEDAFTADPALNGCYVHGGGAAGAVEGLRSIGRLKPPGDPMHVYFATVDNDHVVTEAILEGNMDASASQQPWDLADVMIKEAFWELILGQDMPRKVSIPLIMITQDNIYTPEATVLGCPIYSIMPDAQWDLWPVMDSSEPGCLLLTLENDKPWQLETPTVELRKQLIGY